MKSNIVIGKNSLYAGMNNLDGVHMYNNRGYAMYTDSILNILKPVLRMQNIPLFPSDYHLTCPQALYQKRQLKKQTSSYKPEANIYNIPVKNKFHVLGN